MPEVWRIGWRAPLVLLGFLAQHWIRLLTADPDASTCTTVRLRTKVTKRDSSRLSTN
ncbi:hypothetical protein OG985_42965 [Streptomyces sp. NBC_00289]|uniref:hypothetical protein n=1 Tax=Streptomyces sp. NBC_00289 TaxID=2975703 RepID=UPI00324E2F4F